MFTIDNLFEEVNENLKKEERAIKEDVQKWIEDLKTIHKD